MQFRQGLHGAIKSVVNNPYFFSLAAPSLMVPKISCCFYRFYMYACVRHMELKNMIRTLQLIFDVTSKQQSIKLQIFISIWHSSQNWKCITIMKMCYILMINPFPPVLFSKIFSLISLQYKHWCWRINVALVFFSLVRFKSSSIRLPCKIHFILIRGNRASQIPSLFYHPLKGEGIIIPIIQHPWL